MINVEVDDDKVRVSISKINDCRERVILALTPYIGNTIEGDLFDRAAASLGLCFSKKSISVLCVKNMLIPYVREKLTLEKAQVLAKKIAGNMDLVLSGVSVTSMDLTSRSGWGLVRIGDVEVCSRTSKNGSVHNGAYLNVEVLSGPCSSVRYRKFWSKDMINYAKYRMGFSPPTKRDSGKYPYSSEYGLFNLHFMGFFDHTCPAYDGGVDYTKFLCTPYLIAKNKTIIKKRLRNMHREFTCPKGYDASASCSICPVGLNECPAATHSYSYVPGVCPKCKMKSWMDAEDSAYCVNCRISLSLQVVSPNS